MQRICGLRVARRSLITCSLKKNSFHTSRLAWKESVSEITDGVPKVNLPTRRPLGPSLQHERLLESAQRKVEQLQNRKMHLENQIYPLRELYFNAASRFEHGPKSPAKRAAGIIPDYSSYFPAAVKPYDQTNMALTEIQVHKKFNVWWMRTTGRGPPPKGQVSEKKKRRKGK